MFREAASICFMTYIHALILSLVEGITEFLPISSTGHLVLAAEFLNIQQTEFVKSFEIIIQLGAILAAVVLYARRILTNRVLFAKITLAFIPTAVIGIAVYPFIKSVLLGNAFITTIALLAGGVILIIFDLVGGKEKKEIMPEAITFKQSVLVGCAQVLAMIPGVSRSGATIIGGVSSGMSRAAAIEFSFMLAIPTMLAATGYDLLKTGAAFSPHEWQLLAIGFVGAFVSALIVIKLFLSLLTKRIFLWFGLYRVVLALILLAIN